jgi:hypothetical protein
MAKLFCIFTVMALLFLLIIELFGLRDTTSPVGFLVVVGFVLSFSWAALALIAHVIVSK